MKTLPYLVFCAAALISVNVAAQNTIIKDPNAQPRNLSGFHAIEVSNAINLYVSQGTEEAVAVSASDEKYLVHLRTEVSGGVLKIWYDSQKWNWNSGNKKLKAYVSCKQIDGLSASGASNVYIDGMLTGNRLKLQLSGASDFKGGVKFGQLTIDQSGASDVSITGTVGDLSIKATGASDVKGFDLVSDNCDAQASGASDINISVNKVLNAHVSGASSIKYKGSAEIKQLESSGASSVTKRS